MEGPVMELQDKVDCLELDLQARQKEKKNKSARYTELL